MNVYIREIKAYTKSLLIWSLVMIFLVVAGIGKYTASISVGTDMFNEILKELPKSLQGLFGVGLLDLSKLIDYYAVLFLYIALLASIHAVLLGNGIIAKEERDKTAEFLMVKPVSRTRVITAKIAAAFTGIVIINLVTAVTTYGLFLSYSDGASYQIELMQMMGSLFALQLIFLVVGTLSAAAIGKYKLSSSVSSGVLLAMFLISVMIDISGKLQSLRYLTFFKYYDAKQIILGENQTIYLLISVFVVITLVCGTYFLYRKRDLKL